MVESPQIPGWLRELYPFKPSQWRTSGGALMRYVDEGPRGGAEAVLMLHGNPTWSFYYRNLIRRLSPSLRCVAPDNVGMGLSEKPAGYAYTLASRVRDIRDLVIALDLKRVHLVVHDWGGAIGFGVAREIPERIGRIVITNTAAFPSAQIPFRIAVCRWPVIGTWLVRGANGFAGPATRMSLHRRRLTEAERSGYLYPYRTWRDRVAVDAFVKDIPMEKNHPSRALLEAIGNDLPRFRAGRPLLVWGGRDFCFDGRFLERWRGIYPESDAIRIGDAGHYLLEDARDEAIDPICSYLSD